MEVATNPNNTNTFPNSLPLHIYKSILLFIFKVQLHTELKNFMKEMNSDLLMDTSECGNGLGNKNFTLKNTLHSEFL